MKSCCNANQLDVDKIPQECLIKQGPFIEDGIKKLQSFPRNVIIRNPNGSKKHEIVLNNNNLSEDIYGFSEITDYDSGNNDVNGAFKYCRPSKQFLRAKRPDFASQKIEKPKPCQKKITKHPKKLSPEQYYQYSIAKSRKQNMNNIVENLRHYYKSSKVKYNSKDDTTIISKALKLKWLPTRYINPMKECRFMDYIFPLDSNLFDPDCSKPVSLLFGLDKVKRMTMIEDDLDQNLFRLYMEDLDPLYTLETSPNRLFTFEYYKEWLQSLNNEKAKYLQECLEQYQQTLQRVFFEIADLNTEYFSLLTPRYDSDKNQEWTFGKIWVKKLNQKTRDWIATRPYVQQYTQETNLKSGAKKIKFIEISKKLLQLINVHPSLSSEMKGFEFTERITLDSWLVYWTKRFGVNNTNWFTEFIQNYVSEQGIESPESSDISDIKFSDGNKLYKSAAHIFYREKYIEDYHLYTKTTTIFF